MANVEANDRKTFRDKVEQAAFSLLGNPLAHADADMLHVLNAYMSLKPEPIEGLTPQEARRQPLPSAAVAKLIAARGIAPDAAAVVAQDIGVEGQLGSLPARLYRPAGSPAGAALPIILYFHGGGFVIADLDTYDATPRRLAGLTGALVLSAHYRQAPEHRFPAAHEDAVATYKWLLDKAAGLGGDARRIAVMGESAGGNLAINVAIAARDAGLPPPVAQILVYPLAGVDLDTTSYEENQAAKPLNKPMMQWFVNHLIRSETDLGDPRLDLVGKADLRGLPPATVVTAQIDPLRDDGLQLADRLRQAGVPVRAQLYEGVTHEFFGMAAVVAKAAEAQAFVASGLAAAFAAAAPATGAA